MCNELSFSSKVALDGSSWHVCCLDEEAYPRVLQASDNVITGGCCKQTDNLCPRDPLRGRWHMSEIVSVFAASSFG